MNTVRMLARAAWHLVHTRPTEWPGLARANLAAWWWALPRPDFDRIRSVDTSGLLPREALFGDDPGFAETTWYEPTSPGHFRAVLRRLAIRPRDWTFVDVGCGKGRVVLLAARRPFRRVVGIEAAPDLARVARDNLRSYRGILRCRDVEIVEADVRSFAWPAGPLVVYCYNPFTGSLFDAFLAGLLRAREREDAPLYLVYSHPVEHERVLATGRFACSFFGTTPGPSDSPWNRRYALYRLLPGSSPAPGDATDVSPGLR